jgi:hypothetical protein
MNYRQIQRPLRLAFGEGPRELVRRGKQEADDNYSRRSG